MGAEAEQGGTHPPALPPEPDAPPAEGNGQAEGAPATVLESPDLPETPPGNKKAGGRKQRTKKEEN